MSLRSKDSKPEIYFLLKKSPTITNISRSELNKYAPGELIAFIVYKIPVLGTKGFLILDEEFETLSQKFSSPESGIEFYKRKLASYNARKQARYERLFNENKQRFN